MPTWIKHKLEFNGEKLSYITQCFKDTEKDIKIVGSCSDEIKAKLAATATNSNVTY